MPLLYFVIFITMIQESLFGQIGLNDGAIFLGRTLVDLLSILIFLYAVGKTVLERNSFPLSGTGYERYFFFFFFYCVGISVITTQSSAVTKAAEILVLNRFVFIAMTVPMLANNHKKIFSLFKFLWAMILLQACIGVIQLVGGPEVIDLFRPKDFASIISDTTRSFTSNLGIERRMIIGTVGDFISFGYVMVLGLLYILLRPGLSTYKVLSVVVFLLLVFSSGSRIVFLSSLLIVFSYSLYVLPQKYRIIVLVSSPIILAAIVLFLFKLANNMEYDGSSFLALFRSEFFAALMNQRLGHLVLYIPSIATDPTFILGLSPDRIAAAEYVNSTYSDILPYRFLYSFAVTVEDFYLSALLTYYGVIGTFLFYLMHFMIFRSAWRSKDHNDPLIAQLSWFVVLIVLATHLLSFGNQSFENRTLSLILWLSIGCLSSACISTRRTDGHVPDRLSNVFP